MGQFNQAYAERVVENYLCGDRQIVVAVYRQQMPGVVRAIHESELDWVRRCAELDAASDDSCFPEVAQHRRLPLGAYSLRLAA